MILDSRFRVDNAEKRIFVVQSIFILRPNTMLKFFSRLKTYRHLLEGSALFTMVVLITLFAQPLLPKRYEAKEIVRLAQGDGTILEDIRITQLVLDAEQSIDTIASALSISKDAVRNNISIAGSGNYIAITGSASSAEKALALTQSASAFVRERQSAAYVPKRALIESTRSTKQALLAQTDAAIKDIDQTAQRLDNERVLYQQEIDARRDVTSEAQGRIVGSYLRLLAETDDRQDTLVLEKKNYEKERSMLEKDLREIDAQTVLSSSEFIISSPAIMPDYPVAPRRFQNTISAIVLGVFLGLLWVVFRRHKVEFSEPMI